MKASAREVALDCHQRRKIICGEVELFAGELSELHTWVQATLLKPAQQTVTL